MRRHGLFLCLTLFCASALAIERIDFTLDAFSGTGLAAEAIELTLLSTPAAKLRLEARIKRLRLTATGEVLQGLEIDCADLRLDAQSIVCAQGLARIAHPWLQRPGWRFSLDWRKQDGRLRLDGQALALFGGDCTFNYQAKASAYQLAPHCRGIDLARLRAALAPWLPALRAMESTGRAEVSGKLAWDRRGLRRAEGVIGLAGADFAAAGGTVAGEALQARLGAQITRLSGDRQHASLDFRLSAGALLTPYAYIEPKSAPLTLQGELDYDPANARLRVEQLRYRHPQVLEFAADAQLALDPFDWIELRFKSGQQAAQTLYLEYLQPVLDARLPAFAWQGGFSLQATLTPEDGWRAELDLEQLSVDEAAAAPRFALHGLDGRVHWAQRAVPEVTRLRWQDGALLGALRFGAAALQAQWQGTSFRLLQALELPVLDGSLMIDRLQIRAQGAAPEVDFDGILTPVSLRPLSDSFGWPPLAGSVSGVIPGLSLRQNRLAVAGNLLIQVFGGSIVIRDLILDNLFGYLPTLRANATLRGLDLETLTSAFSFGKITGKLDGHVKALRLEDWRPVAFDAEFATPLDDRSAHHISQRAVDNISNLGGAGIGGSLSRTFLGLFEQFGYERLGIRCLLRDGICHMGGVAEADSGYYLVLGRGIPQINIKGFNRQTDWDRLLQQLKQIRAGGDPVIELKSTN